MNIDDIKLTVLTTMAEATTSPAERHQLMEKIEITRLDQTMRARCRRQSFVRLILFTSILLLLTAAVGQATSFLVAQLFENKPGVDKQSIIELLPFIGPPATNSQ